MLPNNKCNRCGHTWIQRKDTTPIVCPQCSSPYWNRPREIKYKHVI